ncbi:MAG: hypothetical protein GY860_18270, partial [Desulfobacteraceae bacterium]|nr:hypothetical protein [Desulfobacteraceae bacterium]
MLGFGKKKKKDADAAGAAKEKDTSAAPTKAPPEKGKDQPEGSDVAEETPLPKKKKLITKKRIFILLLVLGVIGVSSFLAYTLFFKEKGPETIYNKIQLAHV